jgi:hypothetical protein
MIGEDIAGTDDHDERGVRCRGCLRGDAPS